MISENMMRPPAHPSDHSDAGFTLIEMVIALALLALITALLAGSISGARQVLAVVERNTTVVTIGAVQSYMRAALVEVVPPPNGGGSEAAITPFAGSKSNVQFTTSFAAQGQVGGAYRVSFSLLPAAGSTTFDLIATQTLARDLALKGADATAPQLRSVLLGNIAGFEIGYFGAQGDNPDELQWHSVWTKLDRIPRLVRIDVRFPSGDPRIWHRLQVPLLMAD
jgi:general secretion pathway protein J